MLFLVIKGFNLLLRSASKSNFWQYFIGVIYGNLIDVEIELFVFFYYIYIGFNLLLGFPNNKYSPNNKNI